MSSQFVIDVGPYLIEVGPGGAHPSILATLPLPFIFDGEYILPTVRQLSGLGAIWTPPPPFPFPTGSSGSSGDDRKWWEKLGDWISRVGGTVTGIWQKIGGVVTAVANWVRSQRDKVCVSDCGALWELSLGSGDTVLRRQLSESECRGRRIVPGATIPGWASPCSSFPPVGVPGGGVYGGGGGFELPAWAPAALVAVLVVMMATR